jgi:hypothetical protein
MAKHDQIVAQAGKLQNNKSMPINSTPFPVEQMKRVDDLQKVTRGE